MKHPGAGAQHGLLSKGPGHAEPRLEDLLVGWSQSVGQSMEEPVEGAVGRDIDSTLRSIGPAVAGQDDSVVGIAADDETSRAVHHCPIGRVIKTRIELGDISPQAVPGRPENVADAVFEREVGAYLPAVLDEQVHRRGAPGRIPPPANLPVVGKETKSRVGDGKPGPVHPAVPDFELSVGIVGRPRDRGRHVDLIVIVLSRAFEDHTPLEHVGTLDPRHGVAEQVDRTGRSER